jgi:hypothetical protein
MPALPRLVGALSVLLVLSGCGAADAMREGRAVADALFEARGSGSEDARFALYGPTFFEATPRADWVQTCAQLDERLGKPLSHDLQGFYVNMGFGPAGRGTYVTLHYRVRYAKAEGMESLHVYTPSGGKAAIVGPHYEQLPPFATPPAQAKDAPSGA